MATNSNRNKWFTVDADGLQSLADRRGRGWWVFELIQNALDEPDVSLVEVMLQEVPNRRDVVKVIVKDDAPAGWENLDEARVMFARSKKANDPELRGRFNFGEKLVLSICETAKIFSTSGTISFQKSGRVQMNPSHKINKGTIFEAIVMVPPSEILPISREALRVITPASVELTVNGVSRQWKRPIAVGSGSLPTEFDDGTGRIKRTSRTTEVEVYEVDPRDDVKPTIYEMGIPVCAHDGDHHLNVLQAVPLSMERQSVTPRFMERLYGVALDALAVRLAAGEEDASAGWVTQGFKDAEADSVMAAMGARFGDDAVVFTPGAPESNAEALAAGKTVIPPQSLPRDAWEAVRGARQSFPDLAPSSASAFPTGIEHKAGGKRPIHHEEWSYQMNDVAEYAMSMAIHCIGAEPRVLFYDVNNSYVAWWKRSDYNHNIKVTQRPVLSLNLAHLRRAIEESDRDAIDEVLVHEMAHELESNHLSHEFHDALCKIAVKLRSFDGGLG